jgi:hypothetical protein
MIDVGILFFALGLVARLAGSTLKVPQALYEGLSIYLLLAIGLKGGAELARQPLGDLLPQVAACAGLSFLIPFALVPLLRRCGFGGVDSASLAAHYGSVSVVTFAVAMAYLERSGIAFESHAPLWLAVMEAPALVSAVFLARRQDGQASVHWRHLARDVIAGPSVMLLVGGLAIGATVGAEGLKPIAPIFQDAFKGVLVLFLLELGLVVGERFGELRRFGLRLVAVGTLVPVALAGVGAGSGMALGLSPGGVVLLATLCASASYIAAPTAMRIALPQANAGLSITAALAITFPFNVLVGIPLYAAAVLALTRP